MIAFNGINATSAGTFNVTRLMIEQLKNTAIGDQNEATQYVFFVPDDSDYQYGDSEANVVVVRHKIGRSFLGVVKRLWFEFFYWPTWIRRNSPQHAIVLGNYSFRTLASPKSVLIRHPYLLGLNSHAVRLSIGRRFEEIARTLMFRLTLKCTQSWIVQSESMKDFLIRRWGVAPDSAKVIPNPMDSVALAARNLTRQARQSDDWNFIYPSRWYEHKNHLSILEFATQQSAFLETNHIRIIVTVNPEGGGNSFLEQVSEKNVGHIIYNIGEVPQDILFDWYRRSDGIFFPSECETFGNGLIEGMCFSLPVMVCDREYARSFDENSVVLFEPRDSVSCRRSIEKIINNYHHFVQASKTNAKEAIDSNEWVRRAIGTPSSNHARYKGAVSDMPVCNVSPPSKRAH